MNISEDLERLTIKSFIEELKWFCEEFDEFFFLKESFSEEDKAYAKKILFEFKQRMDISDSEFVLQRMEKAIERLKKKYPEFSDSNIWN
ncbi:MAG: hypothetical protein ACTSR8_04520 [Promethearchaeota archaeon]